MNQTDMVLNTKTYAKSGTESGTNRSLWIYRGTGVASEFSTVSETIKNPVTGTQIKIDFKLDLPIVATEDTSCACAGDVLRTNTATISVWVAKSSTTAERTDLYLRLKDLVADTQFIGAVENLNQAV